MSVTILFVLHGPRHDDAGHSELSAMAARHGLAVSSVARAEGPGMVLDDLGYRMADAYRPYRATAASMERAVAFLRVELDLHEGVTILRHPDRNDPRTDLLIVTDAALATELRQAGFAAAHADPRDPSAIAYLLQEVASAGPVADPSAEMFEQEDDRTTRPHAVPPGSLRPGAAPFPVVLSRAAILAGWTADGHAMSPLAVMEHVTGLMGGTEMTLFLSSGVVVGATHEADGHAMEFTVETEAPAGDLPHPGPFVEMRQYFDALTGAGGDPVPEQSVEHGLAALAASLGLCLAIEVPYDAAAGVLRGFVRSPDGRLEPLVLAVDAED